jgi:hypothetical protein
MSGGTKLTLRERLEYVWRKRRPDPDTGTEQSADGQEVRTPTYGEFIANLKKVAKKPKQG